METLVALDELKARLEWELDADEERLAGGTLEELSDDARYYGNATWASASTAPRQVKSLITRAAARFLRNPDGYTQSRAGDETLGWADRGEDAGTAAFTEKEIKMLRQIGGGSRLHSAPITAWGTTVQETHGFVPVAGGGDPFPYFNDGTPW